MKSDSRPFHFSHTIQWLAFLAAMAIGPRVQAGFSPDFAGLTSTPTTTSFNYTLTFTTANIGGSNQLASGDFAWSRTISTRPLRPLPWSCLPPTLPPLRCWVLGMTPSAFSFQTVDSPSLFNLTFTYTGPTLTSDTNFNASFTLNGQFTTQFINYTSMTRFAPTSGGSGTSSTLGFATQPLAAPSAIPEPASLVLCGTRFPAWPSTCFVASKKPSESNDTRVSITLLAAGVCEPDHAVPSGTVVASRVGEPPLGWRLNSYGEHHGGIAAGRFRASSRCHHVIAGR